MRPRSVWFRRALFQRRADDMQEVMMPGDGRGFPPDGSSVPRLVAMGVMKQMG
jgi:hypothetical protein